MAVVKETAVDVRLSEVSRERASLSIGRCLAVKGFCVLAPSLEDDRLVDALAEARDLSAAGELAQPPKMVIDGLLGMEGSARICDLGLPNDPHRLGGDGLSYLDTELTEYGELVGPDMASMGVELRTRSAGVLHEAGPPAGEGPELTGEVCSKWMTVFAHHRLMCVWCLGPEKGSLELQPFDGESNCAFVSMPPGTLVLLRPDVLQHRFTSAGKAFCLTCFFQKAQSLSKHRPDEQDLTPCCQALEAWAQERMREYKEEGNPEEQARMRLPRDWELMANHTRFVGQHIAVRSAATRQVASWDPLAWTNAFTTGPDYITEVPFIRWDHSLVYRDVGETDSRKWTTTCRHGGFMDGVELFDNALFRLTKMEAGGMDPGHRLILETGYEALVRDGYKVAKLVNTRGGVYVATSPTFEWGEAEKIDLPGSAVGGASIACGRFSFIHGMRGPSVSLEAEGASSLLAVSTASTNLCRVGNWEPIPFALIASYNIQFGSKAFFWGTTRGVFSRSGRTFCFDASADGYVRGDACCALVLKALTEIVDDELVAKDDEEDFLGALVASCTNQSGRRSHMLAPDAAAFQEVIADCIRQAELSPLDVDACDCYADGSVLGDAVEASATAKAYRPDTMPGVDETRPLALLASKGPTGNQLETCGLSSILKVLIGARSGIVHPNLHNRVLNIHTDVELINRPTFLADEAMEFSMESCYVGITNRSFSGTNCHVIAWGQLAEEQISSPPQPQWARNKILFWPEGGGELGHEQLPARGYSIVGTWSGWRPQPLVKEGPSLWTFTITLGINRWERFQILLDEAKDRVLYPDDAGAGKGAHVCGPDDRDRSDSWLIDGRSAEVGDSVADGTGALVPYSSSGSDDVGLPGDRYSIQLRFKGKYRTVDWTRLSEAERGPVDIGSYAIVGTWNNWELEPMTEDPDVPGRFFAEVQLVSGPGYFQLVRNDDWDQVLYPQNHGESDPSRSAVVGPGQGSEAAWFLYGKRGDVYRITFQRSCSAEGADNKQLSWSLERSEHL